MKTSSYAKTILTIIISVAVAAFFMWLAFRGLDFGKIANYFKEANYTWVGISAVFGLLAYWFRAIRWNLLLEPLGHKISNANALWSISFGYLMNLTVPRLGEVSRATALYGVEKVPVDQSIGTIILERIVDLFCLIIFLVLTFIFKGDAIITFFEHSNINIDPKKISILAGILAAGLLAFLKFKHHFKNIPILGKIIGVIDGIFVGALSILKLKQPVKFILYSLAIWVCYYLAAYLVVFALPQTSSFTLADGLFIIVVGTFGMMIPASGGIGAFHFALKLGIATLFLAMGKSFEEGSEIGLAYAFISHTLQLVIMAVMGFISIPMLAKARANSKK